MSRSLRLPTFSTADSGAAPITQKRGRVVDIIWNATLICPWDCAVCCVDAVHVKRQATFVTLRSRGLELTERIPFDPTQGTIYDQAAAKRQRDGRELTLQQKLRVLDHLDGFAPKIDISGGDPLAVSENLELLRATSRRFGPKRVTLTATGAGLSRHAPEKIAPYIGELNFTYDGTRERPTDLRPASYAAGNLAMAKRYAALGIATRAECPLSTQNADLGLLEQIYTDLHRAGIDKLLVMRLFPSGRGCNVTLSTPSVAQHIEAIAHLRTLEARFGSPKVKLQCALKHLDGGLALNNPCDMVHESFGLMADGTLLASPWAIGPKGEPLSDAWVLGNLAQQTMAEILSSDRVKRMAKLLDNNWGHCKFLAYSNGDHPDPFERIFGNTDPMYTAHLMKEAL